MSQPQEDSRASQALDVSQEAHDMTLYTPEEMLTNYAAVVGYFRPPEDSKSLALSSNASVVGGYAESLAAALFVPSRLNDPDTLWSRAVSFKASSMDAKSRRHRREALELTGRSHDKFDLYVPRADFAAGRWKQKPTEAEKPAYERLKGLAAQSGPPYLTCQVKARFAWQDLEYDALPYSVYIDNDTKSWSRNEVLAGTAWRSEAPDLVAWVRFDVQEGRARTFVRLASAEDVRMAIRARMCWEIQDGDDDTASRPNRWTGHKLSFPHAFGDQGWKGTADMSPETVDKVRGYGEWRQWAIGLDVSRAVDPAVTPRPLLPAPIIATVGGRPAPGHVGRETPPVN